MRPRNCSPARMFHIYWRPSKHPVEDPEFIESYSYDREEKDI